SVSPAMDIKMLIRGLAYVVLLGALLATAIAFNNRQYPVESLRPEPSPIAAPPGIKLAHCRRLGAEAANDAVGKAVWEPNHEAYLDSKKRCQDRAACDIPETLKGPVCRSKKR